MLRQASNPGQSRPRVSSDYLALTGPPTNGPPGSSQPERLPVILNPVVVCHARQAPVSRAPFCTSPSTAAAQHATAQQALTKRLAVTYVALTSSIQLLKISIRYSIVDTPSIHLLDPIVFQSPAIIRHDNRTRDILQSDPAPSPEPKPTA